MMNPIFLRAAAAFVLLGGLPSLGLAQAPAGNASPAATTPAPTPQSPLSIGASPQDLRQISHVRQLVRDVQTNSDNIKSKGDFGGQLWLVQGEQFFQDWTKPATPDINPVEIVPRGEEIFTAIIFYGMGRDVGGLSNVSYDITVHRPDGSIYSQRKSMVGWQDLAPPDNRSLELGHDRLRIEIAPTDPIGLYTVDVLLRDNVSRTELPLKQTFVVE